MAEQFAEAPLEKRIDNLERQFAELAAQVLRLKAVEKDWRKTVGMMPDDELSRDAGLRGREWREGANTE